MTGQLIVDCSRFTPLALGTSPLITIDGYPVNASWGQTVFDLPAGHYHLRVSANAKVAEHSAAELPVTVHPGRMTLVHYRTSMPFFPGGIGFTPQRTRGLRFLLWATPVSWALIFLLFVVLEAAA